MFKVGEIVWHEQHGRGEVAYSMPSDVRVMFDEVQNNPLVETEPPLHLSKDEKKETLKSLPSAEDRKAWLREIEALESKAPLNDQVIYWDPEVLGMEPEKAFGQVGTYNHPMLAGYYKVLRVKQALGIHMSKDKVPPQREFHAIEDMVDLKIEHVESGATYMVTLSRSKFPAFYVARKVDPDDLQMLYEEGTFWPEGWDEPTEPEQPEENET